MNEPRFKHLFSPFDLGKLILKNRIFLTGHMTMMVNTGVPNDDQVAYYRARAAGGVSLVITEAAAVHESGIRGGNVISAANDACIDGYRSIVEACELYDCIVFGQLFHPGREMATATDGSLIAAFGPSAVPSERHHVMPAPMSVELVAEIIQGYGQAAERLVRAGLKGIEIAGSMGYLAAQFLNPRVNQRTDAYGGNFENRLRFLREISSDIRSKVPDDTILGLRISADEMSYDGLQADEVEAIIQAFDESSDFDYFNLIGGSSSSVDGSIHIVPPMAIENAYLAPAAADLRRLVSKPVFVAGRINQPQDAERVIAAGQADMCGMTRAMICDPQMPNKAAAGEVADIRACVGCNQACIGHEQSGYVISCIQRPETGRERRYGSVQKTARKRKVMVVGGGPGGMKAAAIAAQKGHEVTLYERSNRVGGQVLLAQSLPGREEFGGVVTNLMQELECYSVTLRCNMTVDASLVETEQPDAVVLATGAKPYTPKFDGDDSIHTLNPWQLLRNEDKAGASVVIVDWRCDWIGLGIAEKLAREGSRVRLCVNGYVPGQSIQQYVRDHWNGILHHLGVEVIPYVRLFGADGDTVYLQHIASGEPVILEAVDTLLLAQGHEPENELARELQSLKVPFRQIGDCLAPRTVEEAVLEGMQAGFRIA